MKLSFLIHLFILIGNIQFISSTELEAGQIGRKIYDYVQKPKFTDNEIFDKLEEIKSDLKLFSQQILFIARHSTLEILHHQPQQLRFELNLDDLMKHFAFILNQYELFELYTKRNHNFENITVNDFFSNVLTQEPNSLRNTIQTIYSEMASLTSMDILNSDILDVFENNLNAMDNSLLCSISLSPQLVIKNFYDLIVLMEWKVYLIMQFAYLFKKSQGQGNFIKERNVLFGQHKRRINNLSKIFQKSILKVSQDYWRCDPKIHVEGKTYIQVTKLLQGHLRNKINFTKSCYGRCENVNIKKSESLFAKTSLFYKPCPGKFVKCHTIGYNLDACPSKNQTFRMYDNLQVENKKLGDFRNSCGPNIKLESYYYITAKCPYCLCICDIYEHIHSDRYINLRVAKADVSNNRVITGLRFVKVNRIIHLQIQEGKLLPMGLIDNSTVRWVQVENYTTFDTKNIFSHQDYHRFSYDKRSIDLDDIKGEDNQVMIGVRFKVIDGHLNFEILLSPFNYETGQLLDPDNRSFYKDNTLATDRSAINTTDLKISTLSELASLPVSNGPQSINLTATSIKMDLAQTTVPFFDTQNVELINPVPLSGAGIYYKGRPGFGGFIAPKIITYSVHRQLETHFSDNNKNN